MKKFLSLVLALIMTMSLVTISAGATEYRDLTDKDEIQYEEAVAVLNRIGVITGYEDGSFRPETELTRGAAAKIIVSLLIGPEAAANLPNATAPYPDVPASHTFAGVISYCKTAKIISGYGDGTFKPGNSLTGFAFAKMLLGALGYNQEIEGFVDTGWTMNVAKVGNVTGLFDRLDFDGAGAVNRETACQLALNTLKATMVTYGGTTMVSGAQTLAVQGTQAMYVTSNNREINANINRRVISAANNEMTLEFGEEHFKDLRLEHDKYDPAYDEYGHPSNEWSWKKVTIGTFKLPADFTFDHQMSHLEDTDATKEKAVGLRNYDTWSTDHRGTNYNWSSPLGGGSYTGVNSPFDDATQITINGWNARVDANGRIYDYDAGDFNGRTSKPTGVPTIAEIADLTDNGVTVEVYVCPVDADFITNVVVTRTQLMKVKRLGTDYVTLEDIEPDSRSPRKDSDLAKITGYNNFAIDVTSNYDAENKSSFLADVKDSNYDAYNALKDMKVGDYVAVVPYTTDNGKTWEVGEAYAPETVSGAFTKVDTYANVNKPKGSAVAITVGGTSYPINEWNKDMLDVTGNEIKATKKDVTLYLAKDGTVLWANEIGNSDAWMIVGDYYQATSASANGKVGWFVHGWTIGGTEVDLDLGTIRGDAEKYAPGELVHYYIAEGGNGEYALEKPNYNGQNRYKDGTISPEKSRATLASGEGIYEVAQYTIDADNPTMSKKYQINKRNGALALENYKTDNSAPPTYWPTYTGTGDAKVSLPTAASDENGVPKKVENKSTGALVEHFFDYSNLLYDGVKFIFVNFDSVNGEVETIDFQDGVQNVDYTDLIRYNTKWQNIGTNDGQKFVLSATEAYVNDKGVVKAVVVKADSSEADLSKIAVITDTPGDRNLQRTGAEDDRTNGLSYAKQYVTGPNFNMSEEKTGYFDKDYPIGTILVISEKDNIIVGKYFHSEYYNNGNPDAMLVEGITPLLRTDGKNSEAGFLIGQDGTVKTLDGYSTLTETMANDTVVTDGSRTVQILTNKYVSGFDTVVNGEAQNLKGLIRVDSTTKFIDLRAINNDTIDNLGDLLDYDPATVRARILVDGSVSTDLFRHAYVVIVEKAEGKTAVATTGNVSLDSNSKDLALPVDNVYGNVTVNRFTGYVDWSVRFKVPEWATKNAPGDLGFSFDIKANGETLTTISVSTDGGNPYKLAISDDVVTASGSYNIGYAISNGVIDVTNDVFSGMIKGVAWKYSNVKYVYEDTKAITTANGLAVGFKDKVSNFTAEPVTFTYTMPATHEAKADTTPAYSISGVTPAQDKVAYADGSPVTSASVKANNGWVTVTIHNVVEKAPIPAKSSEVKSTTTSGKAIQFLVVDEVPAANAVPTEGWSAGPVTAKTGQIILVKAAKAGATMSAITSAHDPDTTTGVSAATSATQIGSTGVFQFTMPANSVTITDVTTDAIEVTDAYYSKTGKLHVISPTGSVSTLATMEAIAEYINNNDVGVLKGLTATAGKKPNGDPTGILLSDGTSINVSDMVVGSNLAKVEVDGTPVIAADVAGTATVVDALALEKISITDAKATTYIMLDKGTAHPTPQATDSMTTVLTGVVEILTNSHKGWAKIDTTDSYTATKTANVGATAGAEWIVTLPAGQSGVVTDGSNTYLPIGVTVNLSVSPKAKIAQADNTNGITFSAGAGTNLSYTATCATPFAGGKDLETTDSVTVALTVTATDTGSGKVVLTPANVAP